VLQEIQHFPPNQFRREIQILQAIQVIQVNLEYQYFHRDL